MPKIEVAYITLKRSLESSDMFEKVKNNDRKKYLPS